MPLLRRLVRAIILQAMRFDISEALPIFRILPRDACQALLADASSRTYASGIDIIREGQASDTVYVLMDGLLRVNRRHRDRIIDVGTITPYDLVGEASALRQTVAGASVRTIQPSRLMHIPGAAIRQAAEAHPRFRRALEQLADQRAAASALAVNPIFAQLPQAVREVILHNGRMIVLDTGETLFGKGEHEFEEMYIVVNGEAEISVPDPENPQEKLILAHAEAGDEIGEIAILCDLPHTADVRALRPCRLLSIRKESVLAWQRRYEAFRTALHDSIQRKLKQSLLTLTNNP